MLSAAADWLSHENKRLTDQQQFLPLLVLYLIRTGHASARSIYDAPTVANDGLALTRQSAIEMTHHPALLRHESESIGVGFHHAFS